MEFAGLEDNGKIFCSCLGCGKELTEIWLVGEDDSMVTEVKTRCCFCDDDTGIIEAKGKIYIGAGKDVGSIDGIDFTVPSTKGEKLSSEYQAIRKA